MLIATHRHTSHKRDFKCANIYSPQSARKACIRVRVSESVSHITMYGHMDSMRSVHARAETHMPNVPNNWKGDRLFATCVSAWAWVTANLL